MVGKALAAIAVCGLVAGCTGGSDNQPSKTTQTTAASSTVAPVASTTATTTSQTVAVTFPADAVNTCMTANYSQRVAIKDPGLRTQEGRRTTCGFAERLAAVVRAELKKQPDAPAFDIKVYSSITEKDRPVACTMNGPLATCMVDGTTEAIYVAR